MAVQPVVDRLLQRVGLRARLIAPHEQASELVNCRTARKVIRDKLIEHKQYIADNGQDLPEQEIQDAVEFEQRLAA